MKNNTDFLIGIFIMSMLFLSGCKVGPNYTQPETNAPESYQLKYTSDTTIANMPWWELFRDTVLQEIIKTTLANNRDLKVAYLRIQESGLQMDIVRSNLYPRIDYSASGSAAATTDGSISNFNPSVGLSYEIDLWGKWKRSNEAAFQAYLSTEEAYRSVMIGLIAEVANNYLLLRDLDNRILISEKMAETWEKNLEIVISRHKAGLVSGVNLDQAEIQLHEALVSIRVNERLRAVTENSISVLMGTPPGNIPRGTTLESQVFPPDIPVGLPSELLSRRPDILQAERELRAQSERIGIAEALKYPSLTLSLDLGATFEPSSLGFASLGAQLFGPLLNLKANQKRVEIEKNRTEQVLNNYEQKFLLAMEEVENAMVSAQKFQQEYELRNQQMQSADSALKLSWIRYESGLVEYLEILDLQRSQFRSYIEASKSRQLQLTSTVTLYKALGGGWVPEQDSLTVR